MAVIGFTIYVLQKSKPIKIETQHGLDTQTNRVAEEALTRIPQAVEKVAGSIERTAHRLADTVDSSIAPVSTGAGALLNSLADRIQLRQSEFNTLKAQSIALAQEVERLKTRHINVEMVSAQLKLGLISVLHKYSSWKKKQIAFEEGNLMSRRTRTEYAGLINASYEIQVGVDIDKLAFETDFDNQIKVFGLRTVEILGLKNIKLERAFGEIRKFTDENRIRSGAAEILEDDRRITTLSQEHQDQILAEIQASQSMAHLADTNAKFALAFLQACLTAGGYKVTESTEELKNPINFRQLCNTLNKRVMQQIMQHDLQKQEVEKQSQLIEKEIFRLATESSSMQ